MARFRYIVTGVDQAVTFYTSNLGFRLEKNFAPAMAILRREDLELWITVDYMLIVLASRWGFFLCALSLSPPWSARVLSTV